MSDSENDFNNINGNNRKVLDSLDPSCNELKHAYDTCFNGWFDDTFLKGEHKTKEIPCDALLQIYSACVKTALKARKIELDDLSSEMNNNNTSGDRNDKRVE
ncbi:uncharacterized protein C119.18 [Folsomia candida]|uniref:TP53-regulated inhibitor of apoptosis 1 n=1 Tax=Folsomia candida TaxID=158441 RepID=A0A226DZH7_FOLCA|nr:uncharacterized protein C119.18 [Folsomia candida]OXA50204.1 hypothetical protein Fcan01_14765 [Folsomia candida]